MINDADAFKEFNPAAQMLPDETCAFIGARGCGKTTAAIAILRALCMNRGFVLCGSPEWKKTWSRVVPMPYIQKEIDQPFWEKWMDKMDTVSGKIDSMVRRYEQELYDKQAPLWEKRCQELNRQLLITGNEQGWSDKKFDAKLAKHEARMRKEYETVKRDIAKKVKQFELSLKANEALFCVIDDLGSKKKDMKHPKLKEIMDNGRHYLVFLMVLVQYAINLPSELRNGCKWLFLWPGDLSPADTKRLWEHYVGGIFKDKKQMLDTFAKITSRPHTCMVVRRAGDTQRLDERVFKWTPPYQNQNALGFLGDTYYQQFAELYYNNKYGPLRDDLVPVAQTTKDGSQNNNNDSTAKKDDSDKKGQTRLTREEKLSRRTEDLMFHNSTSVGARFRTVSSGEGMTAAAAMDPRLRERQKQSRAIWGGM